jgi:hypothetical protein
MAVLTLHCIDEPDAASVYRLVAGVFVPVLIADGPVQRQPDVVPAAEAVTRWATLTPRRTATLLELGGFHTAPNGEPPAAPT